MRRIRIKQTEMEVIDNMADLHLAEQPVCYLEGPAPEPQRLGFLGWLGVFIFAIFIVVVMSLISGPAHAQQGVCNFYGVCPNGGYGPAPSVNVYPPPQVIVIQPQAPSSLYGANGLPLYDINQGVPEPTGIRPCSSTVTTGCVRQSK